MVLNKAQQTYTRHIPDTQRRPLEPGTTHDTRPGTHPDALSPILTLTALYSPLHSTRRYSTLFSTLNSTLNPKPSTLNPQPYNQPQNPKPYTQP